ncbi:MAG: hypothetical protein M1122_02285 [Candidatus Marsarchaeota archaeon]|jgi:carbamoyltransferase|nr:hypothetical protein [Candidatus Marsarchaeota archaeon]
MTTLGIHDMHDAGAATVADGVIKGAINEERFTKKKNDVGFPIHSIRYLLETSEDVQNIAVPWYGGSALFARMYPKLEANRRMLWRKEVKKPSNLSLNFRNMIFNVMQNQRPKSLWKRAGVGIGTRIISKRLSNFGINKKIHFVDHHLAHASSAYYPSGFKEALIITLDGAGDGLSGTVSIGDNGTIKRINQFNAGSSLGIFYGAATIALDMRYSEDEGKLMSLAAYSYPTEIKELNDVVHYDEHKRQLVSKKGPKFEYLLAEYLKNHFLWNHEREAFAYAVQRHVESQVLKIIKQYIHETNIHNVAVAGGFFSNVIVNMLVNQLPEVDNLFVFPQMGDGGLALGAAFYVDFLTNGRINHKQIDNVYYGPEYSPEEIEHVLKKYSSENKITYEERVDIAGFTAEKMVDKNDIFLWFQGRMEYGPRALGNRSVIALANKIENRKAINLIIKKRPYYQPFASTILEEDKNELLENAAKTNRFMTVAYNVNKDNAGSLAAASHIDGTTRPQMLGNENKLYRELLLTLKKKTGIGAVLNTSLNKHGFPIAINPENAIWTLLNTGAKNLSIGSFFVEKKL